jgi:RNA polymerase sigma factor (sigma-70 family)
MTDLGQELRVDESGVCAIVEQLLCRNDWGLLDAPALTALALARLYALAGPGDAAGPRGTGRAARPIEGAAIYCYAEALYAAFAGHEGEERQRAAYYEMLRYVYRVTYRLAPELGADEREEIVYTVVAELYHRTASGGVRVAGAFIAIALQQTRNTVRRWRGVARRLLPALEPSAYDEPLEDEVGASPGARRSDDGLCEGVVRAERLAQIRSAFAQALKSQPRARLQLLVVWLHAVDELDYQAIADQLEMSVANVRVLYSRGRSRLRGNADLQALAD